MSVSTPSPLRAAVDDLEDLPADVLLGRMVLYTITDEPIGREEFLATFAAVGLDKRFEPMPNKYQHAFEKATSDVNGKSYPLGDTTAHVLCRNVANTRDRTTRQITREIQDSHKRQLLYGEVIQVHFHRPSDPSNQSTAKLFIRINPDNLQPGELERVQMIAREIKQRYERYYDFFDAQKIRATVRNYMRHLNCIEIKGGVYFVHANRDEELGRLADLINSLGGGCHMDTVSVVDALPQREFITRSFEREAGQAFSDLTRAIDALMTSRQAISIPAYAKMKARFDALVENASEHMLKLRTPQDVTAESAGVAQDRLTRLSELMLNS